MSDSISDLNALWLIDGSGFIHRAFHGYAPMRREDGVPVNAVFGFTDMMMKLLDDLVGDRVAVVLDAGRTGWRHDIHPDYKANRAETPPDLAAQAGLVREAIGALGLPVLEAPGWEADDLIATYCRLGRDAGLPVTIVTSDKDLMQLVGPGVRLWDPMKRRRMGPAEVMEKFGVPPEKVVDVQALSGDAADNVPGVPGIGPKTAAELIRQFGDLDTLLQRAGEIPQPKRREILVAHADQARLSRRLVRLDADAPLPLPMAAISTFRSDDERLGAWLARQGFRALLNRLPPRWPD
jgi:DNA polymerase-1